MTQADLDLTKKPTSKKWYSQPYIWLIILLLLALGAFLLWRADFFKKEKTPTGYTEDQLPAIKVIVLNGCGIERLAAEFSEHISQKNIEVVSLGDTPRPIYDKSIIVVRKGDMQDLKRLQDMTGIQRWTSAMNEYHSADFDIIVGRDHELFMK